MTKASGVGLKEAARQDARKAKQETWLRMGEMLNEVMGRAGILTSPAASGPIAVLYPVIPSAVEAFVIAGRRQAGHVSNAAQNIHAPSYNIYAVVCEYICSGEERQSRLLKRNGLVLLMSQTVHLLPAPSSQLPAAFACPWRRMLRRVPLLVKQIYINPSPV